MLLSFLQQTPLFPPEMYEKYSRHFTFLTYGLTAAWLILLAFVFVLMFRERKLRHELDRLRRMIENRERS